MFSQIVLKLKEKGVNLVKIVLKPKEKEKFINFCCHRSTYFVLNLCIDFSVIQQLFKGLGAGFIIE